MDENIKLYFEKIVAKLIMVAGGLMIVIAVLLLFYSVPSAIVLGVIGVGVHLYGKAKLFSFQRRSGHLIYSR